MKVEIKGNKKIFHCGKGNKRQWEKDKEIKVLKNTKKDGDK